MWKKCFFLREAVYPIPLPPSPLGEGGYWRRWRAPLHYPHGGFSTVIDKFSFLCYNQRAGTPNNLWKGVSLMDFLAFVASVIAGIIANLVCKWLDGDD